MTLPVVWDAAAGSPAPASELHRPGRIPGTREAVVHPNYILIYRVAEIIEALAVFHARQPYP